MECGVRSAAASVSPTLSNPSFPAAVLPYVLLAAWASLATAFGYAANRAVRKADL
jgi:hypothetical protein